MMAALKGLGKKEREKSPPRFSPFRSAATEAKKIPPYPSVLYASIPNLLPPPPAKKRDGGGGGRRKEKETQTKGRAPRFAFLLSSSALGRKRRTHSFFYFLRGRKNGRAGGEGLQQRKKKDIEGLLLFVAFGGLVGPGWGDQCVAERTEMCISFLLLLWSQVGS